MSRLADLVIRFRWEIIIISVVLTGLLGWKALEVDLNADFSTYLSQDAPAVKEYNRIGDLFGGNDIGVVLLSSDRVFTPSNLELMDQLTRAYEKVEGISFVTSLTNVLDFRETSWGLEVGKLINPGRIPVKSSRMNELQDYVLGNERYTGNLVSKDGKNTAILLQFKGGNAAGSNQFRTSLRVKAVTDSVLASADTTPNAKLYFGGLPFLIYNMTLLIGGNLSTLIPIMIFLLIFVLYLGFRHWAGVIFPLIVVGVSAIWITGIMGILGLQFDLLTGIMPVVLLALGSADAIHLMKRYYELRSEGTNPKQATRETFKHMGMPIILTTVTTMVGFASLFISDFSVIKQFGLLTSAGVLLALIITLTLLPALLSFGIRYQPAASDAKSVTGFWDRFGLHLFNHKKLIVATTLGIVTISFIAIPWIEKDVDWSLCLARGSDPYHAEMLLRQKFDGSLPVQVVVAGDLKDPALLRWMHRIERRLNTIPEVGKAQSMASVLAEMDEVMNGRYQTPEESRGVANLWFLVEGENEIKQLVTSDAQTGLIQGKLATWHTGTLVASVDSINTYLNSLSAKISVIDLDKLNTSQKQLAEDEKQAQILQELKWYLAGEGVEWGPERKNRIATMLQGVPVNEPVRNRIIKQLDRYLASPQAEIAVDASERRSILRLINEYLQQHRGFVSADVISSLLAKALPNTDKEDLGWMAGSLETVANTSIGEARIQPAVSWLASLRTGNDDNFIKNVKGILWGVNERDLFLDSKKADRLLGQTKQGLVREVPFSAHQAGMPEVLKGMEQELLPTQIESLLTALLFVLVLLAIIFRSAVVGLLAIIPISLTIIINFGVMGYLGIGLDSFTAMIASIAIGLGIDTDIHFISRFRDEFSKTGDKLSALQRTLKTTGKSIYINALAVGLGFMVLLFAGGQHIRRFGGLTALTVLVSAVFSLTLLAVLLVWLKPKYLVPGLPQTGEKTIIHNKEISYEEN